MPYGTTVLKQIIDVGLQVGKLVADALKDKKLSTAEIFSLVTPLLQVPGLVAQGAEIKAEFEDLDPAERAELVTYFADKFDLTNDRTEVLIEHALQNAISLVALVEEFKKPKP